MFNTQCTVSSAACDLQNNVHNILEYKSGDKLEHRIILTSHTKYFIQHVNRITSLLNSCILKL